MNETRMFRRLVTMPPIKSTTTQECTTQLRGRTQRQMMHSRSKTQGQLSLRLL